MAKKGRTTSKARLRATDISEIEKNLSILRREEIVSGAPIAEKSNDELFFVDQVGASEAERKKLKERGLLGKPLRIDEILRPSSKIEAMLTRRRNNEDKVVKKVMKNMKVPQDSRPVKQKSSKVYDIWSASGLSVGRSSSPVVKVKAVKVAKPGASYRPTLESHEKLLEEAAAIEVKKMEEQEEIKKLITPLMLSGAAISTIDAAVEEVLRGTNAEVLEEEAESLTLENSEVSASNPAQKQSKRLKRKRPAKHSKNAQELRDETILKKQQLDLTRLKSISRQVKSELAQSEAKLSQRRKKVAHCRILNRLGKVVFTPAPLEVNLPEEIPQTLRSLQTEGNLLIDRYKSLQERALIEPQGKLQQKKKQVKVKMVEPYSSKNFV